MARLSTEPPGGLVPERPGPGQESVWDYPRPPRLERTSRHVVVRAGDVVVADTRRALRCLETSLAPSFYVPPDDVAGEALVPNGRQTSCEWKGRAVYFDVVTPGKKVAAAAWSYPEPRVGYEPLQNYVSFYPALLSCQVDGERVVAQPGDFYGGWITSHVVGPFKGSPGTMHW